MDWPELIKAAPDLLLLVIPGFITVKISEQNRCTRRHDHLDLVLYSILYSFLIGVFYYCMLEFSFAKNGKAYVFFSRPNVKNLAYILLSIVMGLIIVKWPKWRLGKRMQKFFNPDVSPAPSVWISAMKHPSTGAWASVYLNNGFLYTGKLINYTVEFEDSPKELLLTNYRLATYDAQSEDFSEIIEDYTQDDTAQVYLTTESIVAIELKISPSELTAEK